MPVTTNAGGESGPDPATFGGGAGAAGGIVGTNHLQSAVDKFTDSVTKLEGVATKLQAIPALSKGAGMLGSMASGANQPGPSSSGGTFPKLCNPFPTSSSAYQSQTPYGGQMAASPNGGITPPPSSVYPPGQQPPGMPQPQQNNGGFPNVQNPFGGGAQPPPGGGPPATMGGSGGPPANTTGNFPSVQNPYSSAGGTGQGGAPPPGGGAPPNGGGSTHQSPSTTFGELAAGAYTGLAQMGKADMTGQIALNTYQQGSSIGGIGPGGGTYGGNQKALAQQAYGTAGGGSQGGQQKQNIFGTSPQDLAQSFAIMGQQAGNPMLNQSSLGSNLLKGTAQFGYLNPAMSGTQSAQAMQQLYSPQSSMKQRMLGYSTTPLQAGKPGGANSMAKWAAGQFQTMDFGGMNKKPTANQMRAELGPNGIMSANLQAEGLNPAQYAAPLETYNALYQGLGQKGKKHPALNTQQAQKLMSGLSSQDPKKQSASEDTLQNYGVNKNDLDKLKGVAGSKAASQGDKSAGFTAGLAGATRALQDFSQALNQALNTLHANNAVGAGQGFAGTMKTAGGGMGGGLVGGLAAGLAGKGVGGLLGKVLGKSPLGKLFGGGGGAGGAAGDAAGAAGGTEGAAGSAGGGVFGDLMGGLGASGAGGAGVLGGVGMGAAAGTAGIAGGAALAEGAAHHLLGKIPGTKGKGKTSLTGHIGRVGQDVTAFNNFEPQHLIGHMWDAGKNILSGIGGLFGGGAAAAMSPVVAGGKNSKKTNSVSSGVTKTAKTAVKMAESQEGVPYQWGAETPGKGFDCAGLTQWAYSTAGVKLPRTAKEQWEYLRGSEIKLKDVKEGDLVFGEGSGGELGHVGIMVDNKKVIQAPQPGSKVGISQFSVAQWLHAARPSGGKAGKQSTHAGKAGTSKNPIIKAGSKPGGGPAGSPSSSPPAGGGKSGKTTTGATIAAYAEKFAGHKYILGGPGDYQTSHNPPFGAWDCAGFVSQMYDHFGLGSPTAGVNVGALIGWSKKSKGPVVGGMAFFAGSDGTSSHPGHVGMVTGKNKSIQAMDEALGTRNASLAGAVAFGVPPHGFTGGGTAAGGSGGGSGSGAQVTQGLAPQGGSGGMGGADLGTGDSEQEGSTSELAAFGGAISGGASAGSGYYGNSTQVEEVKPGSGSGGSSPGGSGGFSGTGGKAVYTYLLNNVFNGNKIAAAGATGSIWGESGWNPDSQGTGGRGLIGWTPPTNLPNSAFTGNKTKDMAAQLPLIKKFIQTSGDQAAIQAMMKASTVEAAAQIWDQKVERAGINDVHSTGLAQAKKIAGLATGGSAAAGSTILAGERGPELVHVGNQPANVITSDQTQKLLKSAVGSPEGPYSKGGGTATNYSSAHSIFQGGTGNNKSKGAAQVNLNFTAGSIVIQMPSSASSLPTGASARKAATEIVDHLGKMDIYSAISSGSNS